MLYVIESFSCVDLELLNLHENDSRENSAYFRLI